MICGVDEAGRGPVLGPLVVAGVAVDDEDGLRELGVRDSKKLSPRRREILAEEIRKVGKIEIRVVGAADIDRLRKSESLNVIEAKCFADIIDTVRAEHVYVDAADVKEENFRKEISKRIGYSPEIVSKHGADDIYPVVSAASIIAKTHRDFLIGCIAKELGENIGSGYPSDPKTKDFMMKWYGKHGKFPPHTRLSWKTIKNLKEEMGRVTLDQF